MSARIASTVVAVGGLLAGTLVASGGASAATTCTAWGTLPSHVRLGQHPVTVHMRLRGTSGCHTGGVDNGGTATLRGPGAKDPQRWAHFGATDTQTFALRVNKLGTYTLQHASIEVYNKRDVLVPVHWRRTSVVVERKHK